MFRFSFFEKIISNLKKLFSILFRFFKNEKFYKYPYLVHSMAEISILQDLFDQKIISIINVFLENPEKRFTLSEISLLSKINITTTFRIVNRLLARDFILSNLVGKTKVYTLKKGEKSMFLYKFLKKQGDHIEEFLDKLKTHPRVKKIILESRKNDEAKLIVVGDFLPIEKLKAVADEISIKYNFKISFLVIDENQFEDMKRIGIYDLSNKIIWEKKTFE